MEPVHEEAGRAAATPQQPHLHTSPPEDIQSIPTEPSTTDAALDPNLQNLDPTFSSEESQPEDTPKTRPVSGVVPPYWQRHERGASRASQSSLGGPMITLEDHTADPESETSRGLWAQSVSIEDHVVVQGKTGVGAYVVWNCKIQTLDVSISYVEPIATSVGIRHINLGYRAVQW